MAFDRQRAEGNLRETLYRIEQVRDSIERDVLNYRRQDNLTSEQDEYQTMRDIRFYLRKSYHEMDGILTDLDRYR